MKKTDTYLKQLNTPSTHTRKKQNEQNNNNASIKLPKRKKTDSNHRTESKNHSEINTSYLHRESGRGGGCGGDRKYVGHVMHSCFCQKNLHKDQKMGQGKTIRACLTF